MKAGRTPRGFAFVTHPGYHPTPEDPRLLQESSAVGDYPDSLDNPGSSYLWVGENHHLNREEVAELVTRLQEWLKTGHLRVDKEA